MNQRTLPEAIPALFPPSGDRERISDWLTGELQAAMLRVQSGSVVPTIEMQKFRTELEGFDFSAPRSLEESLRWTIECMQCGIVQMSNPRYFGLFNPGANFPSQCADRIAGSFNPQLASSASSPVPVALESHVIRAVGRRAGFGGKPAGISPPADPRRTIQRYLRIDGSPQRISRLTACARQGRSSLYIATATSLAENSAPSGSAQRCAGYYRRARRMDRPHCCEPLPRTAPRRHSSDDRRDRGNHGAAA